jgi:hypothetical protein
MKILAALVAMAAAVALVFMLAPERHDPAAYARADAQIARYEAEAQRARLDAERDAQLAPLYTAMSAFFYIALGVSITGGLAYVFTLMVIDARRQAVRAQMVLPTADGRVPIPVAMLPTASLAALGANAAVKQLAVADQPLDRALTFEAAIVPALPEPVEV